uniref:Uncharacterized protein n=1 Tax=viral metagenome TaxID=1070528 RepID=A0A6C0I3E5_9ZZZZ
MFDAAKDFVFTNSADGKTITSGGYRISKILGGTKKKQRGGRKKKEGDEEEEIENFYNEESGIPMGLLHFGPKFFVEQERVQSPRRKEDVEHNEHNVINLELVMPMPSSSPSHYNVNNVNNCGLEDAKDVVDDDLFCKLLENASLADCASYHSERKMSRKRTLNNINLKNLKVDKVYARRKTRKH